MSPKEKYWQLFDRDQQLKSLPKGFTDQAGLFDQETLRISQELARIRDVPTDLPDVLCLSQPEKERIDKEAKDIHWALNYPNSSMPCGFLETACSIINRNGDACFVYNRLPRHDQEKIQLRAERDKFGKPVYVLEISPFIQRNFYQDNVQNWTRGDSPYK